MMAVGWAFLILAIAGVGYLSTIARVMRSEDGDAAISPHRRTQLDRFIADNEIDGTDSDLTRATWQ